MPRPNQRSSRSFRGAVRDTAADKSTEAELRDYESDGLDSLSDSESVLRGRILARPLRQPLTVRESRTREYARDARGLLAEQPREVTSHGKESLG